jgi:hypothetical protein
MVDLRNFHDEELMSCMSNAANDIESAAKVLLIAARYLKSGELMPKPLAEHLAGAFEASMNKPVDQRLSALGLELNMTVGNSRRKGNATEIGIECDELHFQMPSESRAAIAKRVAKNFKRRTGRKITPETVRTRWDEYKAALQLNMKIQLEN